MATNQLATDPSTSETKSEIKAEIKVGAKSPSHTNPETWTCRTHGIMGRGHFYASDIRMLRYRCKKCAGDVSKRWAKRNPYFRVWTSFKRRATRHFKLATPLTWKVHGQSLLKPMMLGVADLSTVMLTWKQGAKELTPDQLVLTTKPSKAATTVTAIATTTAPVVASVVPAPPA